MIVSGWQKNCASDVATAWLIRFTWVQGGRLLSVSIDADAFIEIWWMNQEYFLSFYFFTYFMCVLEKKSSSLNISNIINK